MTKYNYSYYGSEEYCYPGTNILKNKLNIKNNENLILKIYKSFPNH